MNNNPLDEALEGDAALEDDSISREELLGHYMASLGFRPKEPRAKDTLEYCKTYSDPSGRIGRVVMVIKKDEVGLEPKEPEYATITVQTHVNAEDRDVRAKAPPFCKQDILRVLAHFDEKNNRHEVDTTECELCGTIGAEFMEHEGIRMCLDCARRKGLQ